MRYRILSLIILIWSSSALAEQICVLDETHPEVSVFMCKDLDEGHTHYQEVDPLVAHEVSLKIQADLGVRMVDYEEFALKVTPNDLLELTMGNNRDEEFKPCFSQIYYRVDQFNKLPSSHATVKRLKKLAIALQEANVCDVDVKSQNFNSINVQTKEDLLHHFLCISNSESVFGRDNIGLGGRGPWGIHPAHNQRKGTSAFLDGKTRTLPYDGLCYPSKAIVRDQNEREIKRSELYYDQEVINDNAKCAITLYNERGGFAPWGKTSSWGSNRHCSATTRNRLQFFKHIGELGCCSEACKADKRAKYGEISL